MSGKCDQCGKYMEYKTVAFCSFKCATAGKVVSATAVRTYRKWAQQSGELPKRH